MIKKSFTEISNWIIYWYGTKRNVIVGGEIKHTPYHQTKLFIWALKATLWLFNDQAFYVKIAHTRKKSSFFLLQA